MPRRSSKIRIKLVASPGRLTEPVHNLLDQLDRTTFPEDPIYPKPGCYWWIAYRTSDEDPVGFTGLKPLSGRNAGLGFLCRAGVLKCAAGNGLQRRFIQLRLRKAKALGLTEVVTYTSRDNHRSAANLLRSGMHFYSPQCQWGIPGGLYFHKVLI